MSTTVVVTQILHQIAERHYTVGIVGMGYVGLPLACAAVEAGFRVIGFDNNPERVEILNRGRTGIKHIPDGPIATAVEKGRFAATHDLARLGEPDAILIAVPTPLSKQREPDLTHVENSTRAIARALRHGQLVVLESTTWPGTTTDVMKPILEAEGLRVGRDFFLGFSPEREDPGNSSFGTVNTPKVVGADDAGSLEIACALYRHLVNRVVPVSTSATAEAVKLTENIFRSVNIALVNELKIIFDRMGIDVWEVIEAAKTKPFGYMPFYPGPGLGGHCIPIDPFYLTWKAREYDIATRFIELAGQINTSMPHYVIEKLARALDRQCGRGLNRAKVLIVGLSYKKNIEDTRESPSYKLIQLLEERGAAVDYYDPYVDRIPPTREYPQFTGRPSIALTPEAIDAYDAILVSTDHDCIDWKLIATRARLVVDTRNVCGRHHLMRSNIVRA